MQRLPKTKQQVHTAQETPSRMWNEFQVKLYVTWLIWTKLQTSNRNQESYRCLLTWLLRNPASGRGTIALVRQSEYSSISRGMRISASWTTVSIARLPSIPWASYHAFPDQFRSPQSLSLPSRSHACPQEYRLAHSVEISSKFHTLHRPTQFRFDTSVVFEWR